MHRRQLLRTIVAGSLGAIAVQTGGAATLAAQEEQRLRCVRVETGPVALRSEPVLHGPVVGMAPAGACGKVANTPYVTADGYTWAWITLDDPQESGWTPTWHLAALDAA